jgi:hypothetical protein
MSPATKHHPTLKQTWGFFHSIYVIFVVLSYTTDTHYVYDNFDYHWTAVYVTQLIRDIYLLYTGRFLIVTTAIMSGHVLFLIVLTTTIR